VEGASNEDVAPGVGALPAAPALHTGRDLLDVCLRHCGCAHWWEVPGCPMCSVSISMCPHGATLGGFTCRITEVYTVTIHNLVVASSALC
jgi:hypothetical protein